jgi:hypothetical protein
MPESLIGVVIVLGVLALLGAIFGLLFFVSQAATSGLRAHYAATGPFDGRGWALGYVKIGFMQYNNLVRIAANGTAVHLSIPGHQAIAIPWSELSVEPRAGLLPFSFQPLVTLRAHRVPGEAIVISAETAARLRELAGPSWPEKKETAPAAQPYDSSAVETLKKLGSPWSRPGGDR